MDSEEQPSKSQRKREMEALQETGAQLVTLNAGQLAEFDLPELLLDAIIEAQRIRDFEGRRRQMQYIGRLMREVDAAPIRARLDQQHAMSRAHLATQHHTERWRDRLLADDGALAIFAAEYPLADLQHLRSLIASVKRDRGAGKPPKNYRELFRAVREIVAAPATAGNAE